MIRIVPFGGALEILFKYGRAAGNRGNLFFDMNREHAMSNARDQAIVLFANCARAARGEKCNPKELGGQVAAALHKKENGRGKIVAIGLSEVGESKPVASQASVFPRCGPPGCEISLGGQGGPPGTLQDVDDFEKGLACENILEGKFCLWHLNSEDHCHPEALEKKWFGPTAPGRIVDQVARSRRVYQGMAALVYREVVSAKGVQLRPCGPDPLSASGDDPLEYRGNRDTEPRSATILRQLPILGRPVILVFCQLETNSQDKRIGSKQELQQSPGTLHRIRQIDNLCSHLKVGVEECPVILMGDFNARPGSKELDHLCETYGFRYVLPEHDYPSAPNSESVWGEKYTFDNRKVDRPDYKQSEKAQDWPYSHLEHKILIDHAFVKGLPKEWNCELETVELDNDDDPNERVSDHRPIRLTIIKTPPDSGN